MQDAKLQNLRQLLVSTRRRWTILQMLEFAGLGLLTASFVLAPMLIVLAWKDQSAAEISYSILICSAFLGFLWGLLKRPSNLQTALLIDRQRDLAELFSSAWLMAFIPSPGTSGEGQGGGRAPNIDPYPNPPPAYRGREECESLNEVLLALADVRAKTFQRSSIRLHHLGARAWLLIALMLAINIALIVMASNRASTKARLLAEASNNSRQSTQLDDEPLVDLALNNPARPIMPKDPDDPNASHIGELNSQKSPEGDNHQIGEGTNRKTENARPDGGGTGVATTHQPTVSHPGTEEHPERPDQTSTNHGKTSTGSGVADANSSPQHQSNHPDASARVASPQAPESPWQSPSWHTDVSKAQLAVSRGQVPPAYRDLLSAYFR